LQYYFVLLFYFEEIFYILFKNIVFIIFVCNISNSLKVSNQLLSLIENNFCEFILRNLLFSNLRSNQFASQFN